MSNEVEWQGKVVKLINSGDRCYARKQSNSYAAGVLDLGVSVGKGIMHIECKFERVTPTWKSRKLQYTEIQKKEAYRLRRAGVPAFGLVFLYSGPSNVLLIPGSIPTPNEESGLSRQTTGRIYMDKEEAEMLDWRTEKHKLIDELGKWGEVYGGE